MMTKNVTGFVKISESWPKVKKPLWRIFLLPAVIFAAGAAAGVKAGVEYAKGTYVSKDRKFVEGEVVKEEKENG